MSKVISGLMVSQWLHSWDDVVWDDSKRRREPPKHFYLFSMKASELKRLSGIYRRSAKDGDRRSLDMGIQRRHDAKRSQKIREFVKYGYPFCELTEYQREEEDHSTLKKPGWLPTGIVINILTEQDERRGDYLDPNDEINISHIVDSKVVELQLPNSFEEKNWVPNSLAPIEVIDGQHRLWAFDEEFAPDYEMPVIAFKGLDISWQAYLFWSINITPVRINKSLAYDMYPLLRAEDWVNKEGHAVYQEARAQEIVETLWSHKDSPWCNKINMLAEPRNPYIRQATWIRALLGSFIKRFNSRGKLGGIFGTVKGDVERVLPWTRAQQSAFIIFFGNTLLDELKKANETWLEALRLNKNIELEDDVYEPGMFDKGSLLNTDQGIRTVLLLLNELCVVSLDDYDFIDWTPSVEGDSGDYSEQSIAEELASIAECNFQSLLIDYVKAIVSFDWRTSAAPGLSDEERDFKKMFRGSGGYVELKKKLIEHCSNYPDSESFSLATRKVAEENGYV